MILTYFWAISIISSIFSSIITGTGGETGSAWAAGAGKAVEISIAMAGPLALWNGLGTLLSKLGFIDLLSRILAPIYKKLFPSAGTNPHLAGALSGNICANLLGLGNAATPMGIRAVRLMAAGENHGIATDEMCRLVILNTASIQLLPTTVAAVRLSAGCATPFDILPCVWISSLISVCAGLWASEVFRRLWKDA